MARAFGVGLGAEAVRPLNPQSVSLQLWHTCLGLDCGQFRWEPAIPGLDWLFTPSPRSEERLSTEPLRASTSFYRGFTLPRARSPGFGSCPCDSWRFHTTLLACAARLRFRYGSPLRRVSLATETHSLAHYSERTTHTRRHVSNYRCQVSGSFHSPSRVLFSFPSRY